MIVETVCFAIIGKQTDEAPEQEMEDASDKRLKSVHSRFRMFNDKTCLGEWTGAD